MELKLSDITFLLDPFQVLYINYQAKDGDILTWHGKWKDYNHMSAVIQNIRVNTFGDLVIDVKGNSPWKKNS